MERIKQAVEKARQSRNQVREVSSQLSEMDISDVKPAVFTKALDINQIKYSSTKVVPADAEVFREKRVLANLREDSPVTSAFKMLRTRVLQKMKTNHWNTIGVTSPGAGEGKTLTAVNLAISLAAEGNHTVLLVDLDLKYPSVAPMFGYHPTYDLGSHLFDGVPLPDVLFNPGIERLVVLPAGRPIPNSSETLLSTEVSRLVTELKNRYASRIIIFDLPPMLATDDVLAFSPLLDTALLVVEDGKTRKEEILRSIDMLGSIELTGVVLNKASESLASY